MSDLERIEKKIDELRGDFLPKATVIAMFRVAFQDSHSPSDRSCETCRTITTFLGQPYGCYEYQQRKRAKQ